MGNRESILWKKPHWGEEQKDLRRRGIGVDGGEETGSSEDVTAGARARRGNQGACLEALEGVRTQCMGEGHRRWTARVQLSQQGDTCSQEPLELLFSCEISERMASKKLEFSPRISCQEKTEAWCQAEKEHVS